jgi:hypothetical protein
MRNILYSNLSPDNPVDARSNPLNWQCVPTEPGIVFGDSQHIKHVQPAAKKDSEFPFKCCEVDVK